MPRNEDGEFELILGNKQLLSVFFIVVILLGVFFTMGYIVGRNSSPLSADSRKPEKPLVVDSANRPNPAGGSTAVAPETPVSPPPQEPVKETASIPTPANDTPAATSQKEEPRKAEPPKAASRSAAPTPDAPASGETYLQVAAVQKAEAELFVDVLAKKGFHALYAQVPDKPQTYRVLVGPLKDQASIATARTDLQKAGFKGFEALVRKY